MAIAAEAVNDEVGNRPSLLACNNKLRHLQGISLRNLELRSTGTRPRGRTLDDESLPNALVTPAKRQTRSELQSNKDHSKSSDDLVSQATAALQPAFEKRQDLKLPSRAKIQSKRRRSTMNWAEASPETRQEEMQSVAENRISKVWFSLHIAQLQEPLYISEVVDASVHANFQFFDFKAYNSYVSRQKTLEVKVWAKTEAKEDYELLQQSQIDLSSLHFLVAYPGDDYHFPHTANAMIFHMPDGIYTDLPQPRSQPQPHDHIVNPARLELTASFDTLMRLSNLDACIQDALSTRHSLMKQISSILEEQRHEIDVITDSTRAEEHLQSTQRSLLACRRTVDAASSRRKALNDSIDARRQAIFSGDQHQHDIEARLVEARAHSDLLTSRRRMLEKDLLGQVRRIGEDLTFLYPMHPTSSGSLSFSIRSLRLPLSSLLDEKDHATIAAALGHAAHLTHLLSFYLSAPLPYPLSPRGSTSTVFDPISISLPSEAARTFPLYQKGAAAYRFEYGAFLLNSDIELLMSKKGARMIDLRYTLGNLKYILAVLTVGTGEVPGRKRGTIKALENGSRVQASTRSGGGSSRSSSRAGVRVKSESGASSALKRASLTS